MWGGCSVDEVGVTSIRGRWAGGGVGEGVDWREKPGDGVFVSGGGDENGNVRPLLENNFLQLLRKRIFITVLSSSMVDSRILTSFPQLSLLRSACMEIVALV